MHKLRAEAWAKAEATSKSSFPPCLAERGDLDTSVVVLWSQWLEVRRSRTSCPAKWRVLCASLAVLLVLTMGLGFWAKAHANQIMAVCKQERSTRLTFLPSVAGSPERLFGCALVQGWQNRGVLITLLAVSVTGPAVDGSMERWPGYTSMRTDMQAWPGCWQLGGQVTWVHKHVHYGKALAHEQFNHAHMPAVRVCVCVRARVCFTQHDPATKTPQSDPASWERALPPWAWEHSHHQWRRKRATWGRGTMIITHPRNRNERRP